MRSSSRPAGQRGRTAAGVARRLGDQRHVGPRGERRGRCTVGRRHRRRRRPSAGRRAARAGAAGGSRRCIRSSGWIGAPSGHQRVAERRSGGPVPASGPDPGRRRSTTSDLGATSVGSPGVLDLVSAADVSAEEPELVRGLVGRRCADSAAGRSAVIATSGIRPPTPPARPGTGWPPPCRTSSRPAPGGRTGLGQSERQEPCRPLVDPDVQPQQAARDRRRAARTRTAHCESPARAPPRVRRPRAGLRYDRLGAARWPVRRRGAGARSPARPAARVSTSRACQSALGRPSAAHRSSAAGSMSRAATRSTPSRATSGSVARSSAEQRDGVEPAGVRQLRQRRGQRDSRPDPDRGLHGAGDDHRQLDLLGQFEAGPDAAERLHLEHGDIGGLPSARPASGSRGAADRLVGRDRHVGPGPGQPPPQVGQLLDRRARLLGVLQVVRARRSRSHRPPCRRPRHRWRRSGSGRRAPRASRTAATRSRSSARD